jgi:uncharacterized protein (TIGR00290 family)
MKEGHEIKYLVAFIAETWPSVCHPPAIMELQSKALGIPLLKLEVKQPYEQSYHEAIKKLVDMGIEGIVTGDIYVVDEFHGNWMEKVTKGLDIKVIMPLWHQDTTKVLEEEVSTGFRSVFMCLNKRFTKDWLGREINKESLEEIKAYTKEKGIDPCGENGEYHTMTIDGPNFKQVIKVSNLSKEERPDRLFLTIGEAVLKPKK